MTEVEKILIIDKCETLEELKEALVTVSENGVIPGSSRTWTVEQQQNAAEQIVLHNGRSNLCTRTYGIRQQALLIKQNMENEQNS